MLATRAFLAAHVRGIALALTMVIACAPEPTDSPLPERTGAADTSALGPSFRRRGGPVLLRLTGWANPVVVRQMEAAGLRPLPGYERVERLDSLGLNVVGGTVPANGLESVLALRYVVSIEPALRDR